MITTAINKLWANKHTSGAALLFGVCELMGGITRIWFPYYENQMKQTTQLIQHVAVIYGLVMAGDAASTLKQNNETNTPTASVSK